MDFLHLQFKRENRVTFYFKLSLLQCNYTVKAALRKFCLRDSGLRLGIYDSNKNCHRILSSEQVSNMSAMFVLTN